MTRHLRKAAWATAAAAAMAVAACGGSDYNDSTPAVTEAVPASASESVGGFIDYLMKLVVSAADMLEPVDVSSVVAPTDETGEPAVLP